MSTLLIQSETLESIADAIRGKTGESGTMTPLQMISNIVAIPTNGACVLANYFDNDPNFYANEVHKFTAQMDGTCTFVYYQVCRQTAPDVTVNGTAKSIKTYRLQNNQTPSWGIWIYEFEVETGDEVAITFNFQGGQNNNHVEFILAVIESDSPPEPSVEIIENFSGTFSLPSKGEWKPHTMTRDGYITIMFIATYLGSGGSSAFSIQKNGTEISYTTNINNSTQQARGVYRLPVVAGDIIRCYKNSDCNTPCQYVLLFEAE